MPTPPWATASMPPSTRTPWKSPCWGSRVSGTGPGACSCSTTTDACQRCWRTFVRSSRRGATCTATTCSPGRCTRRGATPPHARRWRRHSPWAPMIPYSSGTRPPSDDERAPGVHYARVPPHRRLRGDGPHPVSARAGGHLPRARLAQQPLGHQRVHNRPFGDARPRRDGRGSAAGRAGRVSHSPDDRGHVRREPARPRPGARVVGRPLSPGVRRGFRRAIGAAGALVLHPLHATLPQLSYDAGDRMALITIRAFADDFQAAAHGASDSAAFAYAAMGFTLTDRDGRGLALAWCGVRRTGDLLWLCLRAPAPGGLAGLRVHARLLFDRYADQINIVQARCGARRVSLLFSRGDLPQPLP